MTQLADGEWHRLHPATPLLRGGIAFIAILGIVIANLRERLVEIFLPQLACPEGFCDSDPLTIVLDHYLLPALLIAAGLLIVIIALFWWSWRMHTFRVTDEVVEVRSGIVFRSHRKARLDRVQGINIVRPLFARIFGAARLEVSTAGSDANVQLAYLGSGNADGLRGEILRRASGARAGAAGAAGAANGPAVPAAEGVERAEGVAVGASPEVQRGLGDIARQRLAEFAAPELDPALAPVTSVVTMHPGRLVGSTLLSSTMFFFLVALAGLITVLALSDAGIFLVFAVIPTLFGFGSFLVRRITRSLRYSIAATPDGVRVGFGLLSTSNETLPPGRIHAIEITQELLWRPADWWSVRITVASHSNRNGAAGQQNTTILPVGSRADVLKVLELVMPALASGDTRELVEAGLERPRPDDRFTTSPRRGAVLRWFSWRRNGFVLHPEALILRRGAIWRSLSVVPTARSQSVAVHQGPVERALGLANVRVHTVQGPVTTAIGALDARDAQTLFGEVAAADVAAIRADQSHRWGGS
ncbi:PH domain-containing protein [Homoserinibacter sp. GY 40078]|uniref:PH domain-containing protein n=1 Tax=Homoserinibacter sp. GY 40078 TaxID=2603275 RepID=UPI0011C9C221|nr:PH domain-containing protein [Homoserinibacter sp. GY 40078]TXK19061.1 PH domain-containing protein [Homoserinibacter sp. GY 40078]